MGFKIEEDETKTVKEGDKVYISCEAKLENGIVCFKSEEDETVDFIVGEGEFHPRVEKALIDMQEGENKTLSLEPEEIFGHYVDGLVKELPKESFIDGIEVNKGSKIRINTPSGKTIYGTLKDEKDETFTIDFNHPLAGKKILFNMTLISKEDKDSIDTSKKTPVNKLKNLFSKKAE